MFSLPSSRRDSKRSRGSHHPQTWLEHRRSSRVSPSDFTKLHRERNSAAVRLCNDQQGGPPVARARRASVAAAIKLSNVAAVARTRLTKLLPVLVPPAQPLCSAEHAENQEDEDQPEHDLKCRRHWSSPSARRAPSPNRRQATKFTGNPNNMGQTACRCLRRHAGLVDGRHCGCQ